MRNQPFPCFAAALVFVAEAVLAVEIPPAVAPGGPTGSVIEDRCPMFSWGEIAGAERYEIAVYRLGEAHEATVPILEKTFPGSVESWTPSLELCLERGERYSWRVRAVKDFQASEWSLPSRFEVAPGPSVADLVMAAMAVRLFAGEPTSESHAESVPGALRAAPATQNRGPSIERSAPRAPVLATLAGDADLQVNGAAVVTVATLAGALCQSTETRFLDRGDGTVLDCGTGLTWLKNANCFGLEEWAEAQMRAASLASGACGLSDGSVAGQWRQPTIGELCSRGEQIGQCPASNAADSLVDTGYSGPALANADGDGQWIEEDAFIDVRSSGYWSANEATPGVSRWSIDLGDGYVALGMGDDAHYVWPVRGGQ